MTSACKREITLVASSSQVSQTWDKRGMSSDPVDGNITVHNNGVCLQYFVDRESDTIVRNSFIKEISHPFRQCVNWEETVLRLVALIGSESAFTSHCAYIVRHKTKLKRIKEKHLAKRTYFCLK